jgi:hypothetical protein
MKIAQAQIAPDAEAPLNLQTHTRICSPFMITPYFMTSEIKHSMNYSKLLKETF